MDDKLELPVLRVDHDRLFKELLRTFFMEFLELFFPEVARYLEPDSLEFLDKEVFTDVTQGERHEADLVARVKFRGRSVSFLILAEAQGKYQKHFPARLFSYFARFLELYGLPVYRIVIYSYVAPLRAEPSCYIVKFPDLEVLRFQFRTVQLNRLNWRHFVNNPNPLASALMARMWIKKADRPKVKAECLRLLATLKLNPAKQQLISGFVDTYLRLNALELVRFKQEVEKFGPEEAKAVYKLTTSWKEEGREEGRVEGLIEGLELALKLRFGSEGAAFLQRLRHGVDLQRLKQIYKALESAADLATLQEIAFTNS